MDDHYGHHYGIASIIIIYICCTGEPHLSSGEPFLFMCDDHTRKSIAEKYAHTVTLHDHSSGQESSTDALDGAFNAMKFQCRLASALAACLTEGDVAVVNEHDLLDFQHVLCARSGHIQLVLESVESVFSVMSRVEERFSPSAPFIILSSEASGGGGRGVGPPSRPYSISRALDQSVCLAIICEFHDHVKSRVLSTLGASADALEISSGMCAPRVAAYSKLQAHSKGILDHGLRLGSNNAAHYGH